jgi:hypothetical protein
MFPIGGPATEGFDMSMSFIGGVAAGGEVGIASMSFIGGVAAGGEVGIASMSFIGGVAAGGEVGIPTMSFMGTGTASAGMAAGFCFAGLAGEFPIV